MVYNESSEMQPVVPDYCFQGKIINYSIQARQFRYSFCLRPDKKFSLAGNYTGTSSGTLKTFITTTWQQGNFTEIK
jgi:hypothetical protein